MLSNQFESTNGHKLQKGFGIENCENLDFVYKMFCRFFLKGDFFVTSFVFCRARFDNNQASLPSVILELKLNACLHL
jgi:hypothetical protein